MASETRLWVELQKRTDDVNDNMMRAARPIPAVAGMGVCPTANRLTDKVERLSGTLTSAFETGWRGGFLCLCGWIVFFSFFSFYIFFRCTIIIYKIFFHFPIFYTLSCTFFHFIPHCFFCVLEIRPFVLHIFHLCIALFFHIFLFHVFDFVGAL